MQFRCNASVNHVITFDFDVQLDFPGHTIRWTWRNIWFRTKIEKVPRAGIFESQVTIVCCAGFSDFHFVLYLSPVILDDKNSTKQISVSDDIHMSKGLLELSCASLITLPSSHSDWALLNACRFQEMSRPYFSFPMRNVRLQHLFCCIKQLLLGCLRSTTFR